VETCRFLSPILSNDPRFPGTAVASINRTDPEPLICVVVTVYNVAPYLDKCLETVTAQTVRNLDIIIVDDASTDDTGEVMSRWEAKDSRIRSLRLMMGTNGGAGQPTNRGIELCRPESKVLLPAPSDILPLTVFMSPSSQSI
jgi:glycosyltransferase involved in cell wall biosynthesis